ncbi:unnamed protein product [Amoebophrya sp. A25]|nr:unnamed protein product [Amoebophrya sp. A25]|eukprot:GSA25T00022600001.1
MDVVSATPEEVSSSLEESIRDNSADDDEQAPTYVDYHNLGHQGHEEAHFAKRADDVVSLHTDAPAAALQPQQSIQASAFVEEYTSKNVLQGMRLPPIEVQQATKTSPSSGRIVTADVPSTAARQVRYYGEKDTCCENASIQRAIGEVINGHMPTFADSGHGDVNVATLGGLTPLLAAVKFGAPVAIVEALVARGADVLHQRPGDEWTVLHQAAAQRRYHLIPLLLRLGADPRLRAGGRGTALLELCRHCPAEPREPKRRVPRPGEDRRETSEKSGNNQDGAQRQQKRGALGQHYAAVDASGALRSILDWYAHKNSSQSNAATREGDTSKTGDTRRRNLARISSPEEAVNERDNEGNTPLMFAALTDNFPLVKLLVERKALLCRDRCTRECDQKWHRPLVNMHHRSAVDCCAGSAIGLDIFSFLDHLGTKAVGGRWS